MQSNRPMVSKAPDLDVATIEEPRKLSLSVVLPVFEEEETIQRLIPQIVETLQADGNSFEVVVVDDGSQDGTPETLRGLQQKYPGHVRVVRHLRNRGNGAALRTGIRVASGDVVVSMDADGQHAPEHISRLTALIPPYDLVIGARTDQYRGGWQRGLANRFYNWFASWLARQEVKDLTSGFRAMRRQAVSHFLHLFPDGFSAPTTTTLSFLKAGYNIAFVPIEVRPRAGGRSKIRLLSDGSQFVVVILRMIMLYDPLRIFLPAGVLLVGIGVLAWVAGVVQAERLVLPNSAILSFIAALLIWLLGLLSSLISNSLIQYYGDETILVDELTSASDT